MQLTITSRHNEVPEALRLRAEAVLGRLARFAHRPTRAQVEFDLEHQRATAELRLHASRGTVHVASAEACDRVYRELNEGAGAMHNGDGLTWWDANANV